MIVTRKRPPRLPDEVVDLQGIPDPPPTAAILGQQHVWRCYLAGVGGMGIGVAGDILVRAGHKEGYIIGFIDKKGLAIRNGGVFIADPIFATAALTGSPVMPFGKADLLIGVDAVEAARAVLAAGYSARGLARSSPRGRSTPAKRRPSSRLWAAMISNPKNWRDDQGPVQARPVFLVQCRRSRASGCWIPSSMPTS